ncbi:MAG TPA: hypothetical protein VET24_15155 [Actinomycetota bacterium]|nr:hypothetical protein [Actinomycetota bacterium]
MNDRHEERLVPTVRGCAHYGHVRAALRQEAPSRAHPVPRRHVRLRAEHERAGGRPDALRHAQGRCWPEGGGHPRHCP